MRRVLRFLVAFLATMLVRAVEEIDVVIEFDVDDDFFKLVSGMRNVVVHLFDRENKNYM